MKKSGLILGFFLAMAMVFSGMVFGDEGCQTYLGEDLFAITRISNAHSEDISPTMADGSSNAGRIAWVEVSYDSSFETQLFLWSEKEGKKLLASCEYMGDYFSPKFMTPSGALVGNWIEDSAACPTISIMFAPENNTNRVNVPVCDNRLRLLAADSDAEGLVYVLGSVSGQLKLWIISPQGVKSETVIVDGLTSSYRVGYGGGLHVDQQSGIIYAVVPTSFQMGTSYLQFLVIFEMELEKPSQMEGYIFGWDGHSLPVVEFGGMTGSDLFGQYDGLPFIYNLASRKLQTFPVCTRGPGYIEGREAVGIFPNGWLAGAVGPEFFFLSLEFEVVNFIVEMPFCASMCFFVGEGMIVYGDDCQSRGNYYYVKIK
ncbi:MAG: hypothetical protein WAV73_05065 [Candidatus Moraniibacteriota bacterium]